MLLFTWGTDADMAACKWRLELTELLLALVRVSEGSVCTPDTLPVLLAAYTASMSRLDRRLLEVCTYGWASSTSHWWSGVKQDF
jgi:hypothetical protein